MQVLKMETTSDPAAVAPVRRAVEALCVACGLDEKATGEVGLCVNEALTNITRHAYDGATDKPVHLEVKCTEDELRIILRDWGNGRTPRPPAKTDPLTPGGLGMVCLKTLMDDISYDPRPDGMLLTMTRRLSKVAVG